MLAVESPRAPSATMARLIANELGEVSRFGPSVASITFQARRWLA